MTPLKKDLAEVVRLGAVADASDDRLDTANAYAAEDIAASNFIRTHHAEISKLANAARRLRALEMAIAEQCNDCASVLQERADEILRAALGESP